MPIPKLVFKLGIKFSEIHLKVDTQKCAEFFSNQSLMSWKRSTLIKLYTSSSSLPQAFKLLNRQALTVCPCAHVVRKQRTFRYLLNAHGGASKSRMGDYLRVVLDKRSVVWLTRQPVGHKTWPCADKAVSPAKCWILLKFDLKFTNVLGPTLYNNLPLHIRDSESLVNFKPSLHSYCYQSYLSTISS